MAKERKPTEISGKIEFNDGTSHEFSLSLDYGWQQWGAPEEQLSDSVELLDVLARVVAEENVMASEQEDD